MTTSTGVRNPAVTGVEITDDLLCVSLSDGREVTVPLSRFPQPVHAVARHRTGWV